MVVAAAVVDLEEAVVAGYTELLGATHADTLMARGNLALTLKKLGDHGAVRRQPSPVTSSCARFCVVLLRLRL